MSDTESIQQADRVDCRVGDWVLASSVPEWSISHRSHPFVPPGQLMPALFHETPEPVKLPAILQWVFVGALVIQDAGPAVRIWRRES